MRHFHISKHHSFYCIGLSYLKADAETRGLFSMDSKTKDLLHISAKEDGVDGILVVATCNRTELYGFAQHPYQLIQLLSRHTKGTLESFQDVGYVHKNYEAINHLFRVGTGLDSQILGDFEIISQLKQSFVRAKKHGLANHFIERLCNAVIRASKRIKTNTELSSGATSVAFASVSYIMRNVPDVANKNILLFGTGKIGRNTCENLVKHTGNTHITLINRTRAKAEKVAGKFQILVKSFEELENELKRTDILVVATGAQEPTVVPQMVAGAGPILILDLSVPRNVDKNVGEMEEVSLIHLDHLSQITDETLARRKAQIPEAEAIIDAVKQDFIKWLESRKYAPVIKALKEKLTSMKDEELLLHAKKIVDFDHHQADIISDRIIDKITRHFANHLKASDQDADDSLELIQKVFQLEKTAR